jgi:hypothetical protein
MLMTLSFWLCIGGGAAGHLKFIVEFCRADGSVKQRDEL